jgi:hypothetical protein
MGHRLAAGGSLFKPPDFRNTKTVSQYQNSVAASKQCRSIKTVSQHQNSVAASKQCRSIKTVSQHQNSVAPEIIKVWFYVTDFFGYRRVITCDELPATSPYSAPLYSAVRLFFKTRTKLFL